MIRYVYNARGDTLIRIEEAIHVHGEDFCDSCGDCLDCYGDEPCHPDGGAHLWIVYSEAHP